jgi:hypothetical protein
MREGELGELAARSKHDISVSGTVEERRGLVRASHMHVGPVLLSTTGKLTHGGLIKLAQDIHTAG